MGEPGHSEVAGVHNQDGAGHVRDRGLVVADVGPVGGADLDQLAPALPEHVGDAKAAAYLHGLPRETMTSLPWATAARPNSTAEALLFTARPASAPVSWRSSRATYA